MPLEQGHHDHLREQPDAGLLQHVPAGPGAQRGRLVELQAYHEPPAPHVGEDIEPFGHHGQCRPQRGTGPCGVLHQMLVVQDLQGGQPGRHGQHAALERGAVHHDPVHRGVDLLEHRPLGQHRADRHEPAGQRLGHGDDVGGDVLVLVGEELAGAAEPALHLVADEQRAVLVQQFRGRGEEAVGRHVHALALDGLDDERRDVAATEFGVERVEVVRNEALRALAEAKGESAC